ncbi:MAG: M48 family metalloprotease [Micavibrio aeruginosavorus]|nr:M48 family metalloprotease [Micavibrio aeruginosavorus]
MQHPAILKQDIKYWSAVGAAYAVSGTLMACLLTPLAAVAIGACAIAATAGIYKHLLPRAIKDETAESRLVQRGEKLRGMLDRLIARAGYKKDVSLYTRKAPTTSAWSMLDLIIADEALVRVLDDDEMEAVLGHELSHVMGREASQKVTLLCTPIVASAGVGILSVFNAVAGQGAPSLPVAAGLSLAAVFATEAIFAYALRTREYRADARSALLTGRPGKLVSALTKVTSIDQNGLSAVDAMFHGIPVPLEPEEKPLQRLLSHHPTLRQRVAALEKLM